MSGIDKPLYTLDKIEENTNKIPKIIFNQYDLLYDMYKAGEYYGALLQVKDVLELAIKFPVLIMLDIAVCYVNDADDVNGSSSGKKDKYKTLEDFLRDALSCEISFGSLERFAKGLAQFEDSIAPSKYRDEFLKVQDLLNKIYRLYYNPVGLEGNENISSWRNRVIGHGAVDADLGRVKEDVEVMLRNLNAILSVSDYRDIAITQIGSSYSVSASENKDKLVLAPYVLVNSEFDTGKAEYSYLFESFNRRGQGKLLDYINNHKKVDAGLSRIYSSISEKLNTKFASDNKLDDCFIKPEDEQEIMDMESRLLVRVPAFFEETKALLARDKGVLLLRAERGTGKTVFSRLIINNFRQNGGNRYKLELKSKNSGSIYKDLGVEKDSLYVCTYNFNNSWMYDRYSFMTSLEEALEPGNDRRNRAYGKAQGRFKNTFLNEYPDADCDEDEYEEYRTKVSFEFNSWLSAALERYKADNENAKLLIVFDGLDEIPSKEDAVNVAELVDEETLPDNVYILCLMRPDSEWRMPKKLKALNLPATEISKDRFEETLCDYIQSNLCGISQNEINAIMEKGDRRFIHVQFVCDIYKLVSQKIDAVPRQLDEEVSRVLVKKEISLLEEYMEIFKQKSKKYYNGLMRLLTVLYLARKPLALDEMYFLYNSVGDERPDFRFYALLRDLRGCISVSRVDGKNLYSIANEEWRNQLSKPYFTNTRIEVLEDMSEYIKNILPENECMSESDILAVKTLIDNDRFDAVLSEKVLKCIENAYESNIENFEKNIIEYRDIVMTINSKFDYPYGYPIQNDNLMISTYPDLYIFSKYMGLVLIDYIGDDINESIGGLEGFNRLIKGLNVIFRDKKECKIDTIEKLISIFNLEIKALYYNDICGKDFLYGIIEEIVNIWINNAGQCLPGKRGYVVLELVALMRAIEKKGDVQRLINNENDVIASLREYYFDENRVFYDAFLRQIDIIDTFNTDDVELLKAKIDDVKYYLFKTLEKVIQDDAYTEQTKIGYIQYISDFFYPIKDIVSPLDALIVSFKWSNEIIKFKYSKKFSYKNIVSIARRYGYYATQYYDHDSLDDALTFFAEVKNRIYSKIYYGNIDLLFYECMIKYKAVDEGNSIIIDADTIDDYIDKFTELLGHVRKDKQLTDVYLALSFYVNTACFALTHDFIEEANRCMVQIGVITSLLDEKSDNSSSHVKKELFDIWFVNLAKIISEKCKDFMLAYLTNIVKIYKYAHQPYTDKIEDLCMLCIARLFKDIDTKNLYSGNRLFHNYYNYGSQLKEGKVTKEFIQKVILEYLYNEFKFDDASGNCDEDDYARSHQMIDLRSKDCYLGCGNHYVIDKLFGFVMSLENVQLKKMYASYKLSMADKSPLGEDYSNLHELLEASFICNDFDKILSFCEADIIDIQDRIHDNRFPWKKEKYLLNLAQAHYFKSLCGKYMGKMMLYDDEYEKFKSIAQILRVSCDDMIKSKFDIYDLKKKYASFGQNPIDVSMVR